jgi:hypothetical protein
VELLELEATLALAHPLAARPLYGTEVTHAHQHHLVDAGKAIPAPRLVLFPVHALHRRKEQQQDVNAPFPDQSLAHRHPDAQDPLLEMNAVRVVTPHLQKYHDPDRPLVAHRKLAMPLPVALILLRALRWI